MKKSEHLLIDIMETYAFPPSPATAREAPPGAAAEATATKSKTNTDRQTEKPNSLFCETPQQFNAKVRAVLPSRGARFKDDHLHTCMYIERSKNANIVAYTPKYRDVTDEGTRLQQKQSEDLQQQHKLSEEEKRRLYEKLQKEVQTCNGRVVTPSSSSPTMDDVASPGSAQSPTRHQTLVPDHKDPMHCYWIKLEPEHVERRRGRGETQDVCELNFLENKMAYGCNVQPLASRSTSPTDLGKGAREAAAPRGRRNSHVSSKCQTFVKELNKQLTEKYKKVKPADKKQKERYTKLSEGEEAAARAWCRYFQPSYAKYVALSAWDIVLLHLPPLTTFEDARAMEETLAAHKKAATSSVHKDPNTTTTTSTSATQTAEAAKEENKKGEAKEEEAAAIATETVPVMLAYIDHKLSIVKKVFVASIEPKHFYQLPTVEYIEAFGTCLETGEPTFERLGKSKEKK